MTCAERTSHRSTSTDAWTTLVMVGMNRPRYDASHTAGANALLGVQNTSRAHWGRAMADRSISTCRFALALASRRARGLSASEDEMIENARELLSGEPLRGKVC